MQLPPSKQRLEEGIFSYSEQELAAYILKQKSDVREMISKAPAHAQESVLKKLSERASLYQLLHEARQSKKPEHIRRPTPAKQRTPFDPTLSKEPLTEQQTLLQSTRSFVGKTIDVRERSVTLFSAWSNALEHAEDFDLRTYASAQEYLDANEKMIALSDAMLEELLTRGKLQPIPDPFWRVDREPEEYTRRLGINMEELLAHFATQEGKQLLLEFGPGNGNARMQRDKHTRDAYVDLAICDKLYWPVNTLIDRLIDFEKLEAAAGPLSGTERQLMCDFLYKILVARNANARAIQLEYDQEVLADLGHNPRSIIGHLLRKAPLLKTTESVPGNGNASGHGVEYKTRVLKPESHSFHRACDLLSAQGGMQTYMHRNANVYDLLPAYPAGTIIADFDRIDRLKDGQIDIAFGIRSTVYKKGEEYRTFMETMMQKIAQDGLYIDDNVRENFGWNYRLADLKTIQQKADYPLYLILGPGVKGEDFQEDKPVPLSVVMTRSAEKLAYVQAHLEPGCSLVKLEDLLAKSEYLETLADGRTHASLMRLAA